MKSIKIKFVDFYKGFNTQDNEFLTVLRKKYDVVFSDDPDYLFYSCFGHEHLSYDCIRIFYTGECVTPDFNVCDYAIGFDRLSFADRYLRAPLYGLFQYKEAYQELLNPSPFLESDLKAKTGFCSFVYSNCFAAKERVLFFEKLSQYKAVSSGGRYRNNVGGPVKDKRAFQAKHKFAIAFENTSYNGYVTEKLMEAFTARTIPIYFGAPDVTLDFNEAAFIRCSDDQDFDEAVQRVIELDQNDELYLQMINTPAIQKGAAESMDDFLYHIVDQDISAAKRRPTSVTALERQTLVKRHLFFEQRIYPVYAKIKSGFGRLRKGAL